MNHNHFFPSCLGFHMKRIQLLKRDTFGKDKTDQLLVMVLSTCSSLPWLIHFRMDWVPNRNHVNKYWLIILRILQAALLVKMANAQTPFLFISKTGIDGHIWKDPSSRCNNDSSKLGAIRTKYDWNQAHTVLALPMTSLGRVDESIFFSFYCTKYSFSVLVHQHLFQLDTLSILDCFFIRCTCMSKRRPSVTGRPCSSQSSTSRQTPFKHFISPNVRFPFC